MAQNRVVRRGITRVDFFRTKYGPELLVDCAWVREMPTFLRHEGPHRLTFFDILCVSEGAGFLEQDGVRYPVAPGTVIFTNPGQVRRWRVERLDGLCLFFEGEFLETYFNDPLFLHRLSCFEPGRPSDLLPLGRASREQVLAQLEEMRLEIGAMRNDSAHLLRAILYQALIRLNRLYAARHKVAADTRANPLAYRFRRLVEERVHREHRVGAYARALGVSAGHLNEVSLRHLGRSAGRYVRGRILIEAKRLLLGTEHSAERIARDLGFRDPSYFGRFFRRETGLTPARFRRRTAG
ncbi:MAG: helix-turn-helix transcriptional regulator [Gemmatimonadales bacterium]